MAGNSGVLLRTLRLVGSGCAIAAAILMITAHQTTYYRGSYVRVEFNNLPAYWCFIFANFSLAGYSLVLMWFSFQKSKYAVALDFVLTMFMTACCSAAIAIGTIESKGNPHTHCSPICQTFNVYCTRVFLATAISLASSLIFVIQHLIFIKEAFSSE